MDGLLVIDKPAGPTSHEVVAVVRRALGERRVGHTGTLDPLATGVLPLVLGRATRLARFLSAGDKAYEATIALGVATDTGDSQGAPIGTASVGPWPSRDAIDAALNAYRGTFLQRPPAFSAKKIAGKRSYALARRATRAGAATGAGGTNVRSGAAVLDAPAPVNVSTRAIEIVDVIDNRMTLRLECSAGFYVRSLAHELGERLGTGAHLVSLRRTRSGDLTSDDAVGLDVVDRDPARATRAVIPLSRMLPGLVAVTLTREGVHRAMHGRDIRPQDMVPGVQEVQAVPEIPKARPVRLMDDGGELVGIAVSSRTPGLLHPDVVLK